MHLEHAVQCDGDTRGSLMRGPLVAQMSRHQSIRKLEALHCFGVVFR